MIETRPELQARARAVAGRLDAPLRRCSSHDAHRRAVIARIRETWARFGGDAALTGMIHEAFKPCEAADVRLRALDDPALPGPVRGALRAGDGMVVMAGRSAIVPVTDLAPPGTDLLFTLGRDGRPARVVSLRLAR